MDPFARLNYHYPGSPNDARFHLPPQGSSYHVPVQHVPPMQDQIYPRDGFLCSDPRKITRAHPLLNATAAHDVRTQQKSTPVGPRGAMHLNPTDVTKIHRMNESPDLSDRYIPSSTDKITCTDHRPLDDIFGTVHSPSKWSHVQSTPGHPNHNGTPRGHPLPASVLSYPLPTKPRLDGLVPVPLLALDNQMGATGLVVDFRCPDWGIGVQMEGVPMSALLCGEVSGLQNPYQCVLDGLGLTDLRFNILWPHYPPFVKVISAFGTDGKPLSRAGLGYEVSLAFAEFFYHITSQSIHPTQPGPYAISLSSPGSSSPGIKFDQLHLITVRNTSGGEWMAEIRAVSVS